jgi:hypothetical protein
VNIFFVSDCPRESAQMLCDKHVVKMTLETAQILSTVLGAPYKPTHQDHPSTLWAAQQTQWTYLHFVALCEEYTFRYGKRHKCQEHQQLFKQMIRGRTQVEWTDPPQCMTDECKSADTISSYRRYYATEKSSFAKWSRGRSEPAWYTMMTSGINEINSGLEGNPLQG